MSKQLHSIFVIVSLMIFQRDLSAQNWTELNVGSVYDVKSISFPSNDTGFVITADNVIRKTSDGGNSWVVVSGPSLDYNGIHFFSGTVGYIFGDSSYTSNVWSSIFLTTNGGNSWTRKLFLPNNFITKLSAPDTQNIFVNAVRWSPSDSVFLLKSTNGGTTWNTNRRDAINSGYQALNFTSPDTGFYTVDQSLYSTFDAGVTWQLRYHDSVNSYKFQHIYFPNKDTGFANGYNFILESTDGGQLWNQKNIPSTSVVDMHYWNGKNGIVCGGGVNIGWIQSTVDEAVSWSMQYSANFSITSFDFPSDSIGYAGAYNGIVLKYTLGPASVSENHSSINFTLLPNPAKGDVILKNIPANSTIRIMDAGGKTVYTGIAASTEMRIDVSAYAPGIYFAEVTEGKAVSRKKFVKE